MATDRELKFATHHRFKPLILVLGLMYVVFAVALAHIGYIALQGKSAAAAGITATSQSVTALAELRSQIVLLSERLTQAQAMAVNSTGSQIQHQMQQLKQDLSEQLSQPLQKTHQTTEALLANANTQFEELNSRVSELNNKIQAPPAAAPAPAAASIRDEELHHIATHTSVCDKQGAAGLALNLTSDLVAPLVIVGHNRPGYLAKTMMVLLKYWTQDPSYATKFPLFISIDGEDQRTLVLATAMHKAVGAQIITRRRAGGPQCPNADCHISQHYKLLLQLFLDCHNAPGLLFLEEDLEVAPDFFSYFEATAPLMQRDSSILCVSAWNDHGQRGRVKDHRALYRTDVMPGLGWYLNAAIGKELQPKWPITNWDDWMRLPGIRNGRSCIYPEVSRTVTFGREGTHGLEGFDDHLGVMQLNTRPVDWSKENLEYLLKANYVPMLMRWLDEAPVWSGTLDELKQYCDIEKPEETGEEGLRDLVVKYPAGKAGYEKTAVYLHPMKPDVREGTPRGSFQGHVVVRCRGRRLFLRAS